MRMLRVTSVELSDSRVTFTGYLLIVRFTPQNRGHANFPDGWLDRQIIAQTDLTQKKGGRVRREKELAQWPTYQVYAGFRKLTLSFYKIYLKTFLYFD